MNFKNVLILSICGLISTNSFSESNWEVITKDNEGMYYEIKTDSISSINQSYPRATHKAWIKSVVVEDKVQDGLAVGDYNLSLMYFDCENNTLGVKSSTNYVKQKNGTVKNILITSYLSSMFDVIPGSIGNAVYDRVCN